MRILILILAFLFVMEASIQVDAFGGCWSNGWGCHDSGCNRMGTLNEHLFFIFFKVLNFQVVIAMVYQEEDEEYAFVEECVEKDWLIILIKRLFIMISQNRINRINLSLV
jgi:hypothetical protein